MSGTNVDSRKMPSLISLILVSIVSSSDYEGSPILQVPAGG